MGNISRVMAKRLHDVCGLPESEPLWRAGRGFVVRDQPKRRAAWFNHRQRRRMNFGQTFAP
jgi:hypothetical protein